MKIDAIINISEIEGLFKEYCKENNIEYSIKKFEMFIKFLEVDFYDWVKANIRQFINK